MRTVNSIFVVVGRSPAAEVPVIQGVLKQRGGIGVGQAVLRVGRRQVPPNWELDSVHLGMNDRPIGDEVERIQPILQ